MLLKELIEKRKKAYDSMMSLHDITKKEERNFTQEENEQFNRANADFDKYESLIDREKKLEKASKRNLELDSLAVPGMGDDDGAELPGKKGKVKRRHDLNGSDSGDKFLHDKLLTMWTKSAAGIEWNSEERKLSKLTGFRAKSVLKINNDKKKPESRAFATTAINVGGAFVPTTFLAAYEKALQDFSEFLTKVHTITTTGGEPMKWPTGSDIASIGVIVAEAGAIGADNTTPFAQATLGSYKFSSNMLLVSNELLEDANIDIASEIGTMLGERLARAYNLYATTGTGVGQPTGIVPSSTLGKQAASATLISVDDIIDLFHSVDTAYRNSPSAHWMMQDVVVAAIRKLKDSTGQPIWSLTDGIQSLLGKPVIVNRDMPAIATTTRPIVFGDIYRYKMRKAGTSRLKRLEERYADTDQTGFVLLERADSLLLNAAAGPVKHLRMA